MGKILFVLSILLASAQAQGVCNKVIKIGWEPYEPFQINEGSNYFGIDFEIMQSIFNTMNCRVEFVQKPWKRILQEIESGTLTVTSSASKTPEREVYAYYSDVYLTSNNVLFVRNSDAKKFESVKTFKDLKSISVKLGVTNGYEYGPEYVEQLKDPKFKSILDLAKDEASGLEKLKLGRVGAMVMNEYTGARLVKLKKLDGQISIVPLSITGDDLSVIFSKKSVDEVFVKEFNAHLSKMRVSGEYKKILAKYTKQ